MSGDQTRQHIVDAADQLFYERGFDATSFADIAGAVKLSRGNFYYHFKTKDSILEAVIHRRLGTTKDMLAQWEAASENPADRIGSFIHILIRNQSKIMQHGCPVGTLCNELAKNNHSLHAQATQLFTLFRVWLTQQFLALGCADKSETHALHILARSQGIATLATAFHDTAFIQREVDAMNVWVNTQIRNLHDNRAATFSTPL